MLCTKSHQSTIPALESPTQTEVHLREKSSNTEYLDRNEDQLKMYTRIFKSKAYKIDYREYLHIYIYNSLSCRACRNFGMEYSKNAE